MYSSRRAVGALILVLVPALLLRAQSGAPTTTSSVQSPPSGPPILTFQDALTRARKNALQFLAAKTDAALATVAGMLPLAFGLGAGSQMLQALAIAVIGGILVSMVLSLVITPAVYFRMADGKNAR